MNEGKSQGSNEIDMITNQKLQGFIKSGWMYSCTGETFSESTGNRGWRLDKNDGEYVVAGYGDFV